MIPKYISAIKKDGYTIAGENNPTKTCCYGDGDRKFRFDFVISNMEVKEYILVNEPQHILRFDTTPLKRGGGHKKSWLARTIRLILPRKICPFFWILDQASF